MSHHPERTARNVRPVNQPPSFGKEAVAVTEASFPPGAVIARKIEKEESGARLKMR